MTYPMGRNSIFAAILVLAASFPVHAGIPHSKLSWLLRRSHERQHAFQLCQERIPTTQLMALRGGFQKGLDGSELMKSITQTYANTQLQQALQAKIQAQVQAKVQAAVANNLLHAAKKLEGRLDDKLREEGEISEEEVEKLREARFKRMKKAAARRQELQKMGHGTYDEVDERDFFAKVKRSPRVVVHFYRGTTLRCEILHGHLRELARSNMGCLFIRVNAEKAPFLVDRLKIKVLPCLKLIKDAEVVHTMLGFEEFGGHDDFKTRDVAAALSRHGFAREPNIEDVSDHDSNSLDLDDFD